MRSRAVTLYKKYVRIIPGIKSYALAAIFIFLLGLVITLLSWYIDLQRIDSQRKQAESVQASEFKNDVTERLNIYEQMLRGASGFLGASPNVNRDEFHRFIEEYDVNKSYPGITAVGYIKHVKAEEVPAYIQSLRDEGIFGPDVGIQPPGDRPVYGLLTYTEPLPESGKKYIGADIYTSKERIEAANNARDSGKIGMTSKIALLSEVKNAKPDAAFGIYQATYKGLYLPSTVEQRRDDLNGFIFATYRASTFFNKVIDSNKFTAYSGVEIYDGTKIDQNTLLYRSDEANKNTNGSPSKTYTFNVFDRPWTFRFVGEIPRSNQDMQRSNMILIGGITISAAIAGFLFLIMLTRARDIVYAKQNEAQQAKDDLLSLASHQLRTPATAVKQYLGMILEGYTGEISERQLPALQKAFASNERQLETINQILYVAKADAGRLSVNKTLFDLNLLVDDIVVDMEDTIEANDQTIQFARSSKKLKIFADESSLRMVLENLINNASKYSHTDTTISVKTGIKNDRIYIAVTDQGVGIAPDDYEKLFKKFSRIDNDLSLQVGGSGIGLYIDRVLVELHGGNIQVESELGKGSTFTVWLPKPSESNLTDEDKKNGSL